MQVRGARRHAAARGAHQEALLDQKRLGDVLERAAFLAERCRQAVDPDRAAVEALDDGGEELAVEVVEALTVYLEQIERCICNRLLDAAIGAHLGVVAHAAQQSIRDPRRAARALRDAARAAGVDADTA